MTKNKPTITVITANYNTGKYVDTYLDGLKNQTLKPTNVVIVDDNSIDNSVAQIQKYTNTQWQPRMCGPKDQARWQTQYHGMLIDLIVLQTNRGPAAARNRVLDDYQDMTDVFAVNDMDDYYHPTKIQKSLGVLQRFSHVGLVYSDYTRIYDDDRPDKREWMPIFNYDILTKENIVSNNSVFDAKVLKLVGLYDESLRVAQDYDLWIRIAEVSAVYHIPESLYTYRVTATNASSSVSHDIRIACMQRIYQKIQQRKQGRSHEA
ncbi:MAG: glycosyltransferase [Clostridia bacterium]|jgi:glycosyltransferase involved in cell wall biosynthesis